MPSPNPLRLLAIGTSTDTVSVALPIEDPAAVAAYASDTEIDLVVIGCPPKSALAGFIHGKIGYKILTSVKRSVFVVHAPVPARAAQPVLAVVKAA